MVNACVTAKPSAKPSANAATGTPHLGYLDGLRGLAALWVVLSHFSAFVVPDMASLPWPYVVVLSGLHHARMAVVVFLVLSGYCLALPQAGGRAFAFLPWMKRRWLRIMPPYFAALALSLAVTWPRTYSKTVYHFGPVTWQHSPAYLRDAVGHALMLHDIWFLRYPWDQNGINAALWSIPVEFHLYLAFPLLLLAWRQGGIVRTALSGLALSWALSYLSQTTVLGEVNFAGMILLYLGFFTFGMMAAMITHSESREVAWLRRLPWGWIAALSWLIGCIICTVEGWNWYMIYADSVAFFFAVSAAAFLIWQQSRPGNVSSRLLSSSALVRLGAFSYSVYLVHIPVILVYRHVLARVELTSHSHFGPISQLWLAFCLGLPLILAASYAFHLAFERPFLRRKSVSSEAARRGMTVAA